jgi:hypothetical protein
MKFKAVLKLMVWFVASRKIRTKEGVPIWSCLFRFYIFNQVLGLGSMQEPLSDPWQVEGKMGLV